MLKININELPQNISDVESVEKGYIEQIRYATNHLNEGMSVLIHCEKQIIPYLQMILRKKMKGFGKTVEIVDGRSSEEEANTSRISNMVNHFRTLIHNNQQNHIFLLPYLDIVTSSERSGLSNEGREIMTIIHENPHLTMVAFEDPDFPIPKLINQAFPVKTEMMGLSRNHLQHLITYNEARKFAQNTLNLMELYTYISGINPVRLREIMKIFGSLADYDPNQPDMLKQYYQRLRNYTLTSDCGLSQINLEKDIAGYGKVKKKIQDNILGLLDKASTSQDEKFIKQIETIIPKGMIFWGPPGTGKTLFAKGIAEAINATVHIIHGPELKSKWFGEGEANIRRLFSKARASAPSVIVFDEMDSIASARSESSDGGASQASHSMVNQLLTEMDGFKKEDLIFVIGTTNFPQSLDPAFLRPGRFEYQIEIPYPDWDDRKAILELYNKNLKTGLTDKEIETLTSWTERTTDTGTPYSGDHLNALIRDLKRILINRGEDSISSNEIHEWLKEKSVSRTLNKNEEKIVSIHESGHLLMYYKTDNFSEVHKITIESGMNDSLGFVEIKSDKVYNLFTEKQMKDRIMILLGGYAAEKAVFGQVSTGASEDLYRATKIAEDMVVRFGMGDLRIPRAYIDSAGNPNPYFMNVVSPQVDAILIDCLKASQAWLSQNKELLQKLTLTLMQKRTLDQKAIQEVFDGENQ